MIYSGHVDTVRGIYTSMIFLCITITQIFYVVGGSSEILPHFLETNSAFSFHHCFIEVLLAKLISP